MFPIRTILHPTDFSECSEAAFRTACSLARDNDARLIALHVIGPAEDPFSAVDGAPGVPSVDRNALRERLRDLSPPDLGIELEPELREGYAAAEILRVAEESQCDLIILGTHGRGEVGRLLVGSVAETVVRGARCSVLTIRTARPQAAVAHGSAKE
jgi:nucleotide-binding universal stress UspA family protein